MTKRKRKAHRKRKAKRGRRNLDFLKKCPDIDIEKTADLNLGKSFSLFFEKLSVILKRYTYIFKFC